MSAKRAGSRWVRFWRCITNKYLLIGASSVLGMYLAIASIVAIPWMEQSKENGVTFSNVWLKNKVAELREAYKDMLDEAQIDIRPLAELVNTQHVYEQVLSGLDTTTVSDSLALQNCLRETYVLINEEYNYHVKAVGKKWGVFLDSARRYVVKHLDDIDRTNLTLDSLSMMAQERRIYQEKLQVWLYDQDVNIKSWIAALQNAKQYYLEVWESVEPDLEHTLADAVAKAKLNDGVLNWTADTVVGWCKAFQVTELRRYLVEKVLPSYAMENHFRALPPFPKPGDGWGIFGLLAQWLLNTRSTDLVLISGMLGFGLLGAAASSQIRLRIGEGDLLLMEKNTIRDFFLPGLMAALVIFLSAKGGVMVIASDDASLNPYVLFFLCLSGSVFSDRIWMWTSEKVKDKFPSKDDKPEEKQLPKDSEDEPSSAESERTSSPEIPEKKDEAVVENV